MECGVAGADAGAVGVRDGDGHGGGVAAVEHGLLGAGGRESRSQHHAYRNVAADSPVVEVRTGNPSRGSRESRMGAELIRLFGKKKNFEKENKPTCRRKEGLNRGCGVLGRGRRG